MSRRPIWLLLAFLPGCATTMYGTGIELADTPQPLLEEWINAGAEKLDGDAVTAVLVGNSLHEVGSTRASRYEANGVKVMRLLTGEERTLRWEVNDEGQWCESFIEANDLRCQPYYRLDARMAHFRIDGLREAMHRLEQGPSLDYRPLSASEANDGQRTPVPPSPQ